MLSGNTDKDGIKIYEIIYERENLKIDKILKDVVNEQEEDKTNGEDLQAEN